MCYGMIFFMFILGLFGHLNTLSAELSEQKLKEFVEKQIENGLIVLTNPMTYTKDKILYYNLGGWENAAMDHDPLSIPLKAQCRLEVIPHDHLLMLSIKKWFPIRSAIEELIDKMLVEISSGIHNIRDLYPRLHDYNNRIDALYEKYINIVLKENGLIKAVFIPSSSPQMTEVELLTTPQGGSIQYITAGNWALYLLRKKINPTAQSPDGIKADKIQGPLLGSTFHFIVTWPNGLAYEGTKTIADQKTLSFKPSDLASSSPLAEKR